MAEDRAPLSVPDQARRRLEGKTGRRFWRALDLLTCQPDFARAAAAEFPSAFQGLSEPGRRQVLKAMAASFGLAGLTACSDQPDEQALPYVHAPEYMVPDKARHYATAVTTVGGYAQPVLGVTHMGRPTKLEGLPGHPCSQGAADAFTQAALLGLYDPDRSQTPRFQDRPAAWGAFDGVMAANAARLDASQGEGLRLLTGQQTSPTFARQWAEIQTRWPKARWHVLEPVNDELAVEAAKLAFGRPLQVLPRLDQADVVVSLDCDLLGPGPAQTRNARLWSARRKAYQQGQGDHHLFVAEPTPSLTGAVAQDRLVAGHGRIGLVAQGLAAAFGLGETAQGLTAREQDWISQAASALTAAKDRGLVCAGAHQPVEVQVLALAINGHLGGAAQTLIEPVALIPPDGETSFSALTADMAAGRVGVLLILETNPAYAAPADSDFITALAKVPLSVHAGLHRDETARACHWHVPLEHDLETWSDARAVDGTTSLIQPLVRPFYTVRSRHVILENLQGRQGVSGRDVVAQTWREAWADGFDTRWAEALRKGFIDGSAPPEVRAAVSPRSSVPPAPAQGLEVIFRPDRTIWDGRFANNPWLQELPKPLNTVTWDNVLAVSPALAKAQRLVNGDLVQVTAAGRSIEAVCWITPGQAPQTVTAFLGYGRRLPDQVGDRHGYDAYPLRTASQPWAAGGAALTKSGGKVGLACAQADQGLPGDQDLVRTVARDQATAPKPPPKHQALTFYPQNTRDDRVTSPSWGMSIDTDLCIGCNACVTACDAENNIAMVGKAQVAEGRQMHWLRVDHYYEGGADAPKDHFQPVPCMQCEQAPCELGCPVGATVHSPDGLNLQVYNRCIGTRTCSSYCPYKVRRFNWFDLTGKDSPELQAQRNPNVTVRSRGVMEKCTYCIQRISEARIQAKIEGRAIADGEVRTACQQTCPTDAIVFGDITDPKSAVSVRKAVARDYVLLEEENTRPRTSYLARIVPGKGDA